jgi:hypothetical protein
MIFCMHACKEEKHFKLLHELVPLTVSKQHADDNYLKARLISFITYHISAIKITSCKKFVLSRLQETSKRPRSAVLKIREP